MKHEKLKAAFAELLSDLDKADKNFHEVKVGEKLTQLAQDFTNEIEAFREKIAQVYDQYSKYKDNLLNQAKPPRFFDATAATLGDDSQSDASPKAK